MRTLGFIGGTGAEGRGLALRLCSAGEKVLIGSREALKAEEAAAVIARAAPACGVAGVVNADAARQADVIFVTVPYAAQRQTMEPLAGYAAGKVVVSVVAPIAFKGGKAEAVRVPEGSAALQLQAILPGSAVVAAFQTISAVDLLDLSRPVESDVIVCGDDRRAKSVVFELAARIRGLRAVDGGGLDNARYVEDFTALLLNINRIYKAHAAVSITGI